MNRKGQALGIISVIATSPLAWIVIVAPLIFFTFIGSLINWRYTIGIIILVVTALLLFSKKIKPVHSIFPFIVALLFVINPFNFLSLGLSFSNMSVGQVVDDDLKSLKVSLLALTVVNVYLYFKWRKR